MIRPRLVVLTVLVALLAPGTSALAGTGANVGALGVAITSAVNSAPVPLAAVIITSADGQRDVVQTSRDGVAVLGDLPAGAYDVVVETPKLGSLHLRAPVIAGDVTILRTVAGIVSTPSLDSYSVGADAQRRAQALGGGGIRGADYMQLGYEVDGVPVNRPFDNFVAVTMSALGVQEVCVYPGAAPIDSQSYGLGGEIDIQIEDGR